MAMRSPACKPRDAGADRLDDAGHLVAQHHRLLDAHGAEAAVLEVVQVRAADAAGARARAVGRRRAQASAISSTRRSPGA